VPCGASNDPMTVPSLSIWIIDGGARSSPIRRSRPRARGREIVGPVVHPHGVIVGATAGR
jgi:hypothetical protein